jgi:hypothetical protein
MWLWFRGINLVKVVETSHAERPRDALVMVVAVARCTAGTLRSVRLSQETNRSTHGRNVLATGGSGSRIVPKYKVACLVPGFGKKIHLTMSVTFRHAARTPPPTPVLFNSLSGQVLWLEDAVDTAKITRVIPGNHIAQAILFKFFFGLFVMV